MALPDSPGRTELHLRRIEMRGYRRGDGLYEIDGRLVDTKSHGLTLEYRGDIPPGTPIHEMWVRLVVDENLVVHDIIACTDAAPYDDCQNGPAAMKAMIGAQIKGGWANTVKQRLGGVKGCTHLMELLMPMATTAYQTLSALRVSRPAVVDVHGRPVKIDSCIAFSRHRDIVKRRWPKFYEPPQAKDDELPASSNKTMP
jgi:hypothetical protein